MTTRRTMAYDRINAFVVVVHNKLPPTDEEWDEYIEFNKSYGGDQGVITRFLVVTDGGAPTAAQIKILRDVAAPLLKQKPDAMRTAVVTPSTFVRGVMNTLSLVLAKPIFRAFSPDQIHEAYTFLGVPTVYRGDIEEMIALLRASLGSTP